MKLADTDYDNSETGCCARVDESSWQDQEFHWQDKPFLRDHVRSFLHLPLNYGSVISRDLAAVEEAEAYPETPLTLTDEVSLWGADLYVAVDGEVPNAQIERLSGTFLSKVFDGPYRDAGKWAQAMEEYVEHRGHKLDKLYYYYATCPRCAKTFGKNSTVVFARVQDS